MLEKDLTSISGIFSSSDDRVAVDKFSGDMFAGP
jgi:hypothetical protein